MLIHCHQKAYRPVDVMTQTVQVWGTVMVSLALLLIPKSALADKPVVATSGLLSLETHSASQVKASEHPVEAQDELEQIPAEDHVDVVDELAEAKEPANPNTVAKPDRRIPAAASFEIGRSMPTDSPLLNVSGAQNGAQSMPIEMIAGLNVIEHTLMATGGDTGVADLFARGDFYPLTFVKNQYVRNVGVSAQFGRTVPGDSAEMDSPANPAMTSAFMGATTRQRIKRGVFVVLARADAGFTMAKPDGNSTELDPLVRGNVLAGAELGTFLLLGELANASTTGSSESSQFNVMPSLIIDWRLRHGGLHPFAVAIVPLRSEAREAAPLILSLGIRYEQ